MTYRAMAVANELLAQAKERGMPLTPMKLQKLVYYAHGWNLAFKGESLIEEDFMAWQFGPVEASIYHEFRGYGHTPITTQGTVLEQDSASGNYYRHIPYVADNDKDTKVLVQAILDNYGKFSATQLSDMTHQKETAWGLLYEIHQGGQVKGVPLPDGVIQRCMRTELKL